MTTKKQQPPQPAAVQKPSRKRRKPPTFLGLKVSLWFGIGRWFALAGGGLSAVLLAILPFLKWVYEILHHTTK